MAYGKKYQIDFDSVPGEDYHLEIHKKNYVGAVLNRIGADVPVLHKWSTDDPKAPLKGSVIEAKLINENGNLPLSDFFSVEDDTFLFKFYHGTDLKFTGYMVQDDCGEEMVDFTHVINLSATDNLGLLKDVSLSEAARFVGVTNNYTVDIDTFSFFTVFGWSIILPGLVITKGDTIIINGTPYSGTYTVILAAVEAGGVNIFTEPPLPALFSLVTDVEITVITPISLQQRLSLAEIINICLHGTNLLLPCNVYSKLKPVGGTTGRWLEDTFLDGSTFLNGETYNDCYRVLETILGRFKATLFQADGNWNIVRWDELRQYSNAIQGFRYTSNMVYNTTITLSNVFDAGVGELTIAETGLTQSILRPYRFVKEKFDYRQPDKLLRNGDFSKTGALLAVVTVGTDTYSEYEMLDWDAGHEWTTGGGGYIASSATRLIMVVRNSLGEEIDRYGVIRGNSGFDDGACADSYPIEISEGDRVNYSFDVKTLESQPGAVNVYFRVTLVTTVAFTPRSTNNRDLNGNGLWVQRGPGVISQVHLPIPAGDNTNQWHTVSVQSNPSPVSGKMFIRLAQCVVNPSTTKETHYKNLRLEVKQSISGQGNVIGHTHTDTQQQNINNRNESEILIDDSPSNSINGTLFLSTFTGALQDRVRLWTLGADITEYKLGNITTLQELFWRRIQRVKLEGTLYGLLQTNHLSLLTLLRYNYFPDSNFIFGQCEIDYRNDNVRGTWYEMYKDTEDDSDLVEIYAFKYIYEKK